MGMNLQTETAVEDAKKIESAITITPEFVRELSDRLAIGAVYAERHAAIGREVGAPESQIEEVNHIRHQIEQTIAKLAELL